MLTVVKLSVFELGISIFKYEPKVSKSDFERFV